MRFTIAMILIGIAVSCCAELYEPMGPPFVTWVRDGKAVAQIVTDEFVEGASRPADILNETIETVTGVALPVVENPVAGVPTVFLGPEAGLGRIADAEALGIGSGGFCILSQGKDLVISGRDRLTTIYGICAFLEECVGVRWFWPGPGGEYVPRTETLRVGQVRKVQNPDFRVRWIGRRGWALRNRMNVAIGQPDEFKTKWFVHTFLNLVPPAKYWGEHPEYYAERGGNRQDPTDRSRHVQLCTSNPEVVQTVARTIDEILRKDPAIRMISVDPMDSQNFCQCANCRALDEPDAPYARKYSRRFVLFYNRVAELVKTKHPDLLIKSIAYHSYVAPPADPDLKLDDNVVIQFCRFECHNHALFVASCPKNSEFNEYFLTWKKIAKNIMFYEYYWKVSWLHLPWPIVHTLKAELPYLRDQGLLGIATQYTGNFGTHGLGYYVAAKLLWDADIDVDALFQDFCEKAYAGAAEPMKEYHARLERAAIESGVHIASQRPYGEVLKLFTPEVLRELDDAVARAKKAAAADERAGAAVDLAARGLEYTHLVVDYLRTIAEVRGDLAHQSWLAGVTPEQRAQAKRLAGPKAEAIRAFIGNADNHPAIGGTNGYIEGMLKPENAVGAWQEARLDREGVRLTKAGWLANHPRKRAPKLPETFDLWIYGNDLDFVGGKPEHTILAKTTAADTVIGHVGTKERLGDRRNRCYIIRGVRRNLPAGRTLRLIVTNDDGGPFASRFFAFYVMPEMPDVDDDNATRMIETDLERVREKAIGFTEYGFGGFMSYENDRDPVDIELTAVPSVAE